MKHSDIDQATHPLLNQLIIRVYDQAFHIFHNGWIDCKDIFHAVFRL